MNIDTLHVKASEIVFHYSDKKEIMETKFKQLIEVNDNAENLAYLTERAWENNLKSAAKQAFEKFMHLFSGQSQTNEKVFDYVQRYTPCLG